MSICYSVIPVHYIKLANAKARFHQNFIAASHQRRHFCYFRKINLSPLSTHIPRDVFTEKRHAKTTRLNSEFCSASVLSYTNVSSSLEHTSFFGHISAFFRISGSRVFFMHKSKLCIKAGWCECTLTWNKDKIRLKYCSCSDLDTKTQLYKWKTVSNRLDCTNSSEGG